MMEQGTSPSISMALDMKKNRIRIHKPTIHLLGDPTLIQLLFDPEKMVVAIVCPHSEVPGGQEIRVNPKKFKGEYCVEFYSKMFFHKLRSVHGSLDENCTYRLTGIMIPELRAARFPLSTLRRVEGEEGARLNG